MSAWILYKKTWRLIKGLVTHTNDIGYSHVSILIRLCVQFLGEKFRDAQWLSLENIISTYPCNEMSVRDMGLFFKRAWGNWFDLSLFSEVFLYQCWLIVICILIKYFNINLHTKFKLYHFYHIFINRLSFFRWPILHYAIVWTIVYVFPCIKNKSKLKYNPWKPENESQAQPYLTLFEDYEVESTK